MKKIFIFSVLGLCLAVGLVSCGGKCPNEPIVKENQKLIVPPNFGKKPA